MLDNFRPHPSRDVSVSRYRELAEAYDTSCQRISRVRQEAIRCLELVAGETVIDVACGTGAALPALAAAVGPGGCVVGIEQSPEMMTLARQRVRNAGLRNVLLLRSAAEDAEMPLRADAVLFAYAHDVLQSPAALDRVFSAVRPGARVCAVGLRLLPWWAAPVNAWLCWRISDYVTTFRGLRRPWLGLLAHCPDLRVVRYFHAGTSYLAHGRVRGDAAQDELPLVRQSGGRGP